MKIGKYTGILVILMVLALLIRIAFLFLNMDYILSFVADDFFYALVASQNIVSGNGLTFDGISLTNGVHIIYIILLLPLANLFQKSPIIYMKLALLLLSIFNIATSFIIFKIISLFFEKRTALFTSFLWLFSPIIFRSYIAGVESAVNCFFLSLVIYFFLKWKEEINIKKAIALGILAGIAFLSRADSIFISTIIFFCLLLPLKKIGIQKIKKLIAFSAAALATVSPWLIWSYNTAGTILQTSGIAIAYQRHTEFLMGHALFSLATISKIIIQIFSMIYVMLDIFGSPGLTAFLIGLIAGLFIKINIKNKSHKLYYFFSFLFIILPFFINDNNKSAPNLAIIGICSIGAFIMGIMAHQHIETNNISIKIKNFFPLLAYIVLIIAYYGIYAWHFQAWYYASSFLVLILFLGAGFSIIPKLKQKQFYILLIILFCLLMLKFGVSYYNVGIFPQNIEKKEMADWINENIMEDKVLGSFNSGLYGFFCKQKVVNLDGVMNNNAHKAIKEKRLWSYISANLDYLIEYKGAISHFKIFAEEDYLNGAKLIYEKPSLKSPTEKNQVYKI